MNMYVKVLGACGSNIPKKNLSSYLLGSNIVFDAGNITSYLGVKAQTKIEHIFITHPHLDHIKDIAFLADNRSINGKGKQLLLYSTANILSYIKEYILNDKIWPDFSSIPDPTNPIVKLCPIEEEEPVLVEGYTITAYKVNHPVPAVGYLVERDGKSLFYTGDTGPTKSLWEKLSRKIIDVLIVDVSLPNRMKKFAIEWGHLTPELLFEDLKILKEKPKRIYIAHVKYPYAKQIEKELKKLFGPKFKILRGGELIKI